MEALSVISRVFGICSRCNERHSCSSSEGFALAFLALGPFDITCERVFRKTRFTSLWNAPYSPGCRYRLSFTATICDYESSARTFKVLMTNLASASNRNSIRRIAIYTSS